MTTPENVLEYIETRKAQIRPESYLGSTLSVLFKQRSIAYEQYERAFEEHENANHVMFDFASQLVVAVAKARNDQEFLKQLAAAQVDEDSTESFRLTTDFLNESGIGIMDRQIPDDLLRSRWNTVIAPSVDEVRKLMLENKQRRDEMEKQAEKMQAHDLAAAVLIAIDRGEGDVAGYLYPQLSALMTPQIEAGHEEPQEGAEVLYQVTDYLREAMESRPVSHAQLPDSLIAVEDNHRGDSEAPHASITKPVIHWSDFGLDSGSAEWQGFSDALLKLKQPLQEQYAFQGRTLNILEELRTMDESTVLVLLSTVYMNVSDMHLARVLALLACEIGYRVPDWNDFVPHAQLIKEGTADTVLPIWEQKENIQIYGELPVEPQAHEVVFIRKPEEIRTDRFPTNNAEVKAFIESAINRIRIRVQESGLLYSETQLYKQDAFETCGIKFGTKLVDIAISKGNKFITPDEMRGRVPYFSFISFIKLLALSDFEENYGMSNGKVRRILEKFDDVYTEMKRRQAKDNRK